MQEIFTREADTEDKQIIWEWWNDPHTRAMMKLNDFVPWQEHTEWFDATIKSKSKILLISSLGESKIGVVRFDLRDFGLYEVSINLNPQYRGEGYGSKILSSSIKKFLTIHPKTKRLFASFKKINLASKQTFIKSGFSIKESSFYSIDTQNEEYCELNFNENKEVFNV